MKIITTVGEMEESALIKETYEEAVPCGKAIVTEYYLLVRRDVQIDVDQGISVEGRASL